MKKLSLNRETLKLLTPADAGVVRGGMQPSGVTSTKGCDGSSKTGKPCSSGCPTSKGSGCC